MVNNSYSEDRKWGKGEDGGEEGEGGKKERNIINALSLKFCGK